VCAEYDSTYLEERISLVHRHEKLADDLRRELEVMMYSKALFPESRGDVLGMIETTDKVANQAEAAVRMMKTHHISLPKAFHPHFVNLLHICRDTTEALLSASRSVFRDYTTAAALVGKVDQLESDADQLEADLTESIFASGEKGWNKLLLRDLIRSIAKISDRAESAGDRIRIIVAKRSI
jgi:predicted phosphate transport protein (TIGR00153 family)